MSRLTETHTTDIRRGDAASLLNREAPPEYIAEWTKHVAAESKAAKPGTQSAVIFRIDKEWLALPTDSFQEVMDEYTIRTLPGSRGAMVRGLVNVRGELMLCVDLAILLGMEPGAAHFAKRVAQSDARDRTDRLLIFRHGHFAVPVDEVFGVHRYHPDDLRLAPATLRKASSNSHTMGLLRWQERSVAILDNELLLRTINKGLA